MIIANNPSNVTSARSTSDIGLTAGAGEGARGGVGASTVGGAAFLVALLAMSLFTSSNASFAAASWGSSSTPLRGLALRLRIMFATIGVGPTEEGVRGVGIDPDRLVVIGDGAIKIVLLPIRFGPAIECRGGFGLRRDRGVIIRDGAIELAL